ncbi:malonyl-ACP O-methyltransferase BioC [Paenibacillus sp. N4]|uniref:malonyl-ACP O-methyltransferase BioC n=1 Tax=Paenibacillus vietnamensis TaxID=2590547 RepID=UPI001CD18E86|nr:malonyl-ACP O-methyltransferase BioC [Paenibacillus vietnamensis]MCA0756271.1 malonyl-ACP O-methyltransferase BioC [Paenibacillus vietnamensis]
MSADRNSIERQFNKSAAESYDRHALVQRDMAGQLASSLADWKPAAHTAGSIEVLEIGCGTGSLTEMLLHARPDFRITAVDIAQAMVDMAGLRIESAGYAGRARFLRANAEEWAGDQPEASYDLIVSSACFQWLADPRKTAVELRRLLRPGGLLAFATFGPATFHELHESFAAAHRMYGTEPERHGLSFLPATDWTELLEHAGFSRIRSGQALHTETHAGVRAFLHSVKAAGAGASAASSRGLGYRRLLTAMFQQYERRYAVPGGISATYELLFIHGETHAYPDVKLGGPPCLSPRNLGQ